MGSRKTNWLLNATEARISSSGILGHLAPCRFCQAGERKQKAKKDSFSRTLTKFNFFKVYNNCCINCQA